MHATVSYIGLLPVGDACGGQSVSQEACDMGAKSKYADLMLVYVYLNYYIHTLKETRVVFVFIRRRRQHIK